MKNTIAVVALLYIISFSGLSGCVFAQPDSVGVDTLISKIYIKFWEAAEIEIPDEFAINIIKPETAYAIAERVMDPSGAYKSEWVFSLQPPGAMEDCEYKPHIRGLDTELMGTPNIEFAENEWIAKCIFRLTKIWQVSVKSDPGRVDVLNLNLQLSELTDYTTPPMPWEEELTLELHCVPKTEYSYSVILKADSLFKVPGGIVHDNEFIKNRILDNIAHKSIYNRVLISNQVKVEKIVFKPKVP